MSHLHLGSKGYILILGIVDLDTGIYVSCEWSKKGIRKPLSRDCIAGISVDVIFLKVLR